MDQDCLTKALKNWEYKEHQLEGIIKKINKLPVEILEAFSSYLNTGEYPVAPTFFGITPADLATNYPFKPPAVFLCLDWIRREPEAALNALVDEYQKRLPSSFDPNSLREYLDKQNETDNQPLVEGSDTKNA